MNQGVWTYTNASATNPTAYVPWLKVPPKSTINEAKKRSVEMDGIFDALVDSGRARPDLDLNNPACLVDVLLAREKAGDITTEVLEQLISDLLHAGIDASTQTVRWLLLILANRPEIQDKVHEEQDQAIGLDAIPALKDRERLPYLNVAILENMQFRTVGPLGLPHKA